VKKSIRRYYQYPKVFVKTKKRENDPQKGDRFSLLIGSSRKVRLKGIEKRAQAAYLVVATQTRRKADKCSTKIISQSS